MSKPAEFIYLLTPWKQPKEPQSIWTKKDPPSAGWRKLKYQLVEDAITIDPPSSMRPRERSIKAT